MQCTQTEQGRSGTSALTLPFLARPFPRRTCPAPAPPIGGDCSAQPPANFYTCCTNKAAQGKADK